jgi:allantoinase
MYDLIIQGGTLVNPRGKYHGDVAIKDGKIVLIASQINENEARECIRAVEKFVLPGCIDSHMHLWEPGLVAEPNFKAGTLASIAGGVTTIIDHPLTIPEVLNKDIFHQKIKLGEETSYTDFALHGGVGHDNLADLAGLWEAGCTAFKIFMCDSGSKVAGLSTGELLAAFREIGRLAGTVLLHAENDDMLRYNRKQLEAAGRKDPMAFVEWRPPEAEAEAIHRALYLLRGTGARAVFLHTTVPEGVDMVQVARKSGMDVWVETCPHILYLTHEDLKARGPWVTFSPPMRDPARVELLWKQLAEGAIQTMGSDHGPVDAKLKIRGEDNIWEGQGGLPDAETLVPLMLHAVANGKITLERLTDVLAETPARLYGLYPRKGAIQVGSDADFTIVDLSQTYPLHAKEMNTSCGWIPYEGMTITGRVTHTILRGKIAVENGQVLGQPGDGRFIRRANPS